MIERIKRTPLRDVWKHEAHDFTTWLEENIDALSEVLDFELSGVEREKAAGSFSVDLVAETGDGKTVVIENQLEKSNHDHLGKLLTYLTMLDASIAIWIVAEPRPEHVKCITWLNESSNGAFYLIKLESIVIGDSSPAPLLTVIAGPSEEARQIGLTKKDLAERQKLRYRFWEGLLERSRKQTKLHANISPVPQNWVGTGAGISGMALNYAVRQTDAQAELYIDRGKGRDAENALIFDAFYTEKDRIERDAGLPINWEKLEAKRACRISIRTDLGGWRSPEDEWPTIHDKMIESMIALEKALRPTLRKLAKSMPSVPVEEEE